MPQNDKSCMNIEHIRKCRSLKYDRNAVAACIKCGDNLWAKLDNTEFNKFPS